jgi:hypothetical protein
LPREKYFADCTSYNTMPYYKPDGRLLIAEYLLDFDDPVKPETYRQQYFALDSGKFAGALKNSSILH